MRYLIILILVIFAYAAVADVSCDKHPIYCQITKNNSNLTHKYVMNLSNIIYKAAKKHNINPTILTAIFAQESMYNLKARNCVTGLVQTDEYLDECRLVGTRNWMFGDGNRNEWHSYWKRCDEYSIRFKEHKVCMDFGIAQINHNTAAAFGFNIFKLTEDLEYSVNAGAIVLSDFQKRFRQREPSSYWTRYNASSPSKREIYRTLVKRFYNEGSN